LPDAIVVGSVSAMKTIVDRAGRIVVPKPLQRALGLKPGQPLEIRAADGNLPPLTAEQLRDVLERLRR